jgi:hypothetical protein
VAVATTRPFGAKLTTDTRLPERASSKVWRRPRDAQKRAAASPRRSALGRSGSSGAFKSTSLTHPSFVPTAASMIRTESFEVGEVKHCACLVGPVPDAHDQQVVKEPWMYLHAFFHYIHNAPRAMAGPGSLTLMLASPGKQLIAPCRAARVGFQAEHDSHRADCNCSCLLPRGRSSRTSAALRALQPHGTLEKAARWARAHFRRKIPHASLSVCTRPGPGRAKTHVY